MKKIGIVLIAAMLMAGGYFYFTRPSNPLLTGIPPKDNSDGTIDYTLLMLRKSNQKTDEDKITEWVFRFPKELNAQLSDPVKAETSNGSVVMSLGSNRSVYFYLDVNSMAPVPRNYMEGKSFNSVADNVVSAHIFAFVPRKIGEAKEERWKNDCIATGRKFGNLIEYGTSNSDRSLCNILPNDNRSRLYVLPHDPSQTMITCKTDEPACNFSFWYDDLVLSGNFGKSRLDKYENIAKSILEIIAKAKLSERTVQVSQYTH